MILNLSACDRVTCNPIHKMKPTYSNDSGRIYVVLLCQQYETVPIDSRMTFSQGTMRVGYTLRYISDRGRGAT